MNSRLLVGKVDLRGAAVCVSDYLVARLDEVWRREEFAIFS